MEPITWIVIGLTLAGLATIMFICCCIVGKRADEQSDELARRLGVEG